MMEDYMPKKQIMEKLTKTGEDFKSVPQHVNNDLLRQTASKMLTVGLTSLEIYRNDVPKKVKLLDVKLSFSYQEDFTTKTVRLEKDLVRKGKKWTWYLPQGERSIVTFPYSPGDRVNLNIGMFVHKTERSSLFSRETITEQVGNVTECIVLAKNNGVGMGLPLNTVISQHVRLNFNLFGKIGHHFTVKLKLEQIEEERKGNSTLWLRPSSPEKLFFSQNFPIEILKDSMSFPPRVNGNYEGVGTKSYVCTSQRLVNYLRTPVLECWSFRTASSGSEIPSSIQIKQVTSNKPVACLVPVVEFSDNPVTKSKHMRLGILVICGNRPYCLCSTKWRTPDKFDFKIHYYDTDETWGQRVKWASRDFLDIGHVILNSTGHLFTIPPHKENPLQDLCVGLCMKYLVRWSEEVLPWKRDSTRPVAHIHGDNVDTTADNEESVSRKRSTSCPPIGGKLLSYNFDRLPSFLESHELALYCDIEKQYSDDSDPEEEPEETQKSTFVRKGSGSSYGERSFRSGDRQSVRSYERKPKGKRKDFKKRAIEIRNDSDADHTSGFVDDYVLQSEIEMESCIMESYIG